MRYYAYLDYQQEHVSIWVRHKGKERVIYNCNIPDTYIDYMEWTDPTSIADPPMSKLVKAGLAVPMSEKDALEWIFLQE